MDWGGTDRPTRVNMVSSVLVALKGMLGHFYDGRANYSFT